jgi:hypothetical protein
MDDPHERFAGTRAAIAWLTQQLQTADAVLQQRERATVKFAAGADGNLLPQPVTAKSPLEYFKARLDRLATQAAAKTARLLLADLKTLTDELTALGREIEQLARTAGGPPAATNRSGEASTSKQEAASQWLRPRLAQLAEDVDTQLAAECLQEQGLWPTIMQGGRRRAQLTAKLNEFSRHALSRALGSVNVMDQWSAGSGEIAACLRSHLAAATPSLLELGGTRRVLAVLPSGGGSSDDGGELSKSLGVPLNVVRGADNSMSLCVEAAGLPIEEVAVELVQRRRDRVEFAGRVQSRTDIEWTPLVSESAATSNPWAALGQSSEFSEQVMAKTMVL